ncbi:hypothetical protein E3N88_16080 [Mikania micrantha]|uniref:Uncharacterized protein n=1 Tax=Mikania micrantha TaxID=192012 RepID=A0A5N6NX92_9ASTR|nr:hypothetical protein E3N88_16080 [Mikania micrantha]
MGKAVRGRGRQPPPSATPIRHSFSRPRPPLRSPTFAGHQLIRHGFIRQPPADWPCSIGTPPFATSFSFGQRAIRWTRLHSPMQPYSTIRPVAKQAKCGPIAFLWSDIYCLGPIGLRPTE